jgi:DegV family protein with EDD domain
MQIVTDSGADLAPEQLQDIHIHSVPLTFSLDGKSYRGGIDIQPDEFYTLLENTHSFPTTSQPAPGDFAELYRRLAVTDPDILSIHISSGLSGTFNAAKLGAQMVPEASVTFYDTRTLSGAQGWHVEAAAHAINAGWQTEQIVEMLTLITAATDIIFSLATLKYLIHGGRISHIRGLLGSILDIKPIIGVEKEEGKYVQRGAGRSFNKSLLSIADLVAKQYAPGTALRAQVLHANYPEGAGLLREKLDGMFDCTWLPTTLIAPVLGAHTGPGLAGLIFAPQEHFAEFPWSQPEPSLTAAHALY